MDKLISFTAAVALAAAKMSKLVSLVVDDAGSPGAANAGRDAAKNLVAPDVSGTVSPSEKRLFLAAGTKR